jgi:hypothetical protein
VPAGIVFIARWLWPPRGLDEIGWIVLRDSAASLALAVVVIALSVAIGRRLLLRLAPADLIPIERDVFAAATGLASLAYTLLALALMGVLRQTVILILLLGLSLFLAPDLGQMAREAARLVCSLPGRWRQADGLHRVSAILMGAIGLLALAHSLSPPWDYDGLMYHLVGPKLFLDAGRLYPVPDNWYVNGPFTVEMVFSLGMAFGDDVFPKLIHFSTGILLVLATCAAGQRWLGGRGGWLSAVVLLGVPALPIWAAFAYIDVAWSLFEFLAIVAVFAWWSSASKDWLVLGGLMAGLAMGSKYLGLIGFGLTGLFVAGVSLRRGGWRHLLRDSLAFGVPAVLVASPWYLKNLLWFANPVYPLYFGARGWSETRLDLYQAYLQSFGEGTGPVDILLLPWSIYARHVSFGAVMNRIDVPGLLFPILAAYPFLRKERTLTAFLWIALARVGVWALGSQQIRFLLPLYPGLAVGAAYVAETWKPRSVTRIPWQLLLPTLAVGLMGITGFYQWILVVHEVRPLPSVVGLESRRSFLERNVNDFRSLQFAQEELPPGSWLLMIGDGRGYYCPSACLPDPDHFRWAGEIDDLGPEGDLGAWFTRGGVSHVLLSVEDLDFLLQHDPRGALSRALERLLAWRDQGCLKEVFDNGWSSVLMVTCQ